MLKLLVTFLLFNLSLTSALRANSTVPLQNAVIECLNPEPGVHPIVYNDCQAALTALRREPQFNDRRIWDHRPDDDWIVRLWVGETCTIALAVERPRARDAFSLALVGRFAERVIEVCVRNGDHRGGNVRIGVQQLFDVVVVRTDLIGLAVRGKSAGGGVI